MEYKSKPRKARITNKGGATKATKKYARKYTSTQSLSKGRAPQIGTSMVINTMPIFPTRTMKRLRYSDNFFLTSASGAVASYVFSANGLYDPNITGTGHQPMGFDQMMQFYNHYCVTWARATIVAVNQSTGFPCQLVIRQDSTNTPITSIDRILEAGGSAYTHLDLYGSTNSQKELSLIVNVPKLQGVTLDNALADATLRGDASANPTEQTYFHIQIFNSFGSTISAVNFDIIIEYISYFAEPRDQALS